MISRRQTLLAAAATPLAAFGPAAAKRALHGDGGPLTSPPEASVRTTNGPIRGFRRGPVYTFKGIPYGATAAGAARFLPPKPPAPWTAERDTFLFGPTSYQPVRDRGNPWVAYVNDWDDGYPGEDCLCLNVWTTSMQSNAKRPVMVWLHGGGYTTGSSQEQPAYDGGALAERDVVLVSVNHRLGPIGFLDLSSIGGPAYAASGNAGMMDIVLALQWVRDNIAKFGGDPGRVTIFGQSGGGGKVSTLMAMPSAKGLFHRAIVMSGSMLSMKKPADNRPMTEAVMAELGARDVAALQAVPPMRLIEAGAVAQRKLAAQGRNVGLGFGPVFDGSVVAEDWGAGAPRVSADVPLMVGSVRDEFRRWGVIPQWDDLPGFVPETKRANAPAIVAALRKAYPQARPIDIGGFITGLSWRANALEQCRRRQALGAAPVYNYYFTYVPAPFDRTLGVPHCADIAYAFDNVALNDTLTGNTPEAKRLADKVSSAFVNFAATGDPAQPGLPWAKFDPARMPTMVFDTSPRMVDDPAGEARRLMV